MMIAPLPVDGVVGPGPAGAGRWLMSHAHGVAAAECLDRLCPPFTWDLHARKLRTIDATVPMPAA